MRDFARLCLALDDAAAVGVKLSALEEYFRSAQAEDAAWVVHLLGGGRPKRLVSAPKLRAWAAAEAGSPDWLFEECYRAVGDLAETIALLLPDPAEPTRRPLAWWIEQRLLPLRGQEEVVQHEEVLRAWRELAPAERFVWNRLITGAFRAGAAPELVVRALARTTGVDEGALAHRLTAGWEPTPEFFRRLVSPDVSDAEVSRPYPFFPAQPLEAEPETLGVAGDWLAEWQWDGVRAQLVRRTGRTWLWSRAEELLNGRVPEVEAAAAMLPEGTVLDGELVPWADERPLPFVRLQRRLGRTSPGRKLVDEVPVVFLVYDLLEEAGEDVRALPLAKRRSRLTALLARTPSAGRLMISPAIEAPTWHAVAEARRGARERGAKGLVLKRLASGYGAERGDWWTWKVPAFGADAVLMYAQPEGGRGAGLCTEFTFGVWDGETLVPFARVSTGLSEQEIRRLDAFIRRNTLEKHGPVRVVRPDLVFELTFEGIEASSRHKSGVAVRSPRIVRRRPDTPAAAADTLAAVRALILR